jgi:HTH-type transcriptional repressor of NAD biosynthesis genes
MSSRFESGLVVGKFCPLHRGHELVIRRALAECARTFVLSWSRPELPGCEPARRARWLSVLFPAATSLVLTDEILASLDPPAEFAALPDNRDALGHIRRFTAWFCEAAWKVRPDAVFTSEPDAADYADELTRWFRRAEPTWPAVSAVLVDPERAMAPISGTALRADVHAGRAWLSPAVYRDFVQRVVLLGGESTGKSSLAEALAVELGTVHVAEYGRELWEARGGRLEPADLLRIGEEQVSREEAALAGARGWLVCDTSPLTTLFYSRHLFGRADPALEALAERRYDVTVLCAPDFPFVQDGTRQDDAFRRAQHDWYLAELDRRGIRVHLVTGSMGERLASLRAALGIGELVIRRFGPGDLAVTRGWRYPPPYDFYNDSGDEPGDAATVPDDHFALVEGGELIGFFSVGEDARVPGGTYPDGPVDIGMGMRPDLTGRGQGGRYLTAAVEFARRELGAGELRATVADVNERALRLCDRAGFRRVLRFDGSERAFWILIRAG